MSAKLNGCIVVAMTIVTLMACSSGSQSGGGGGASVAQTNCQSGGLGTWNAQYNMCTCISGYTWDSLGQRCLMNTQTSNQTINSVGVSTTSDVCLAGSSTGAVWNSTTLQCSCPSGMIFNTIQRACLVNSGTSPLGTMNSCAVGQVMINGMCQSVANITEQQGCQATGGLWTISMCQCPAGLTWQAAWKSCQTFGANTGSAQQICLGSGGTPGVIAGQCLCPSTSTLQTYPTGGYQYCMPSSLLSGPNSAQNIALWINLITQLLTLIR